MGNEEVTIIVVSVLCVVIVIAAIIAVSVYFCCGNKNRRKNDRYQRPATESNHSQATPVRQDEPAPQPLPKVGSSGLWMSKPIMHAPGPNDAYNQLKPNGVRKEPVMMREILSSPNVNQPTSGYIYQGNLRMYHSQQLPNLVGGYGEHPSAYFNEAFIYPTYVDARLSHRSSMRFLEASGYYGAGQMSREAYHSRDVVPRRQSHRESFGVTASRNNSDLRQTGPKPQRFQQKSPQHEKRKSRSTESEANSGSSFKNKSASSSTASGVESVIERRSTVQETIASAKTPTPPVIADKPDESSGNKQDEATSPVDEDVRTQAENESKVETAIPSTSTQIEPDSVSLDNMRLPTEQRDIPFDQQSYVDSVSDATDLESKGQKITTQAFEFLDTYISDADDDVYRPKCSSGKS